MVDAAISVLVVQGFDKPKLQVFKIAFVDATLGVGPPLWNGTIYQLRVPGNKIV